MGYASAFLTPHPSMQALQADPVERMIAYRALFDSPQPESELGIFRTAIQCGLAVGSPEFIERVAMVSGRRATRRNAGSRVA